MSHRGLSLYGTVSITWRSNGSVAHNHIGKPAGGNASQGRGEAYALDVSSKNGCRKIKKMCDSPGCKCCLLTKTKKYDMK